MIHHLLWHEVDLTSAARTHPKLRSDEEETMQNPMCEGVAALIASNESRTKVEASKRRATQQETGGIPSVTREAMRQRLSEGMVYHGHEVAWMLCGASEDLEEKDRKTAPLADDEIEVLLSEVVEIKALLFCRALLAHPGALLAALQAPSIEAFLNDESVTQTNLRDICLKMEHPGLQELRDACADFRRNGEDENDDHDAQQDARSPSSANDCVKKSQVRLNGAVGVKPSAEPRRAGKEKITESRRSAQDDIGGGVCSIRNYIAQLCIEEQLRRFQSVAQCWPTRVQPTGNVTAGG